MWGPLPPETLLGVGSAHVLEQWLRRAMTVLLLKEGQLTPAGLRAGGATHDYLAGSPVERLMWRGRWAAFTVLKQYVQECASVLATAVLPWATQQRLARMEDILGRFLDDLAGSWQ